MGGGRADDVPGSSQARNAQHFQSQTVVGRIPVSLPLPDQPRRTSQPNSSDSATEGHRAERTEGDDVERSNVQSSGVQDMLKGVMKDGDKNKAFTSRTYHTIKDMISSRFGSGKIKDGIGNGEAGSTNGAEAGNKAGESGQNSTMTLNNASGEGTSKCVRGSPCKITPTGRVSASIRKQDVAGGISNSEGYELSQNQDVLGGGPQQSLGSSRNYCGEKSGETFHRPHTNASRQGTVDGPPGRGCDGDGAMGKSGRAPPGSYSEQQGLYASVQQDRGADFPGIREYLPPQTQKPVYGNQRPHLHRQHGMVDQNGIYMVMRQNGQGYQYAVPASSQESQCGLQDQEPDMRRQNIACVLSYQHPEGSQQLTEGSAVSNYGTPNTVGLIQRETGGSHSCRGSQSRLDEDDDEGGFTSGSRGSSVANNLRGSNHSAGGENFMKAVSSGNYNQQQSSGQSSDYEKATQRSTGQSSSNADSGRGSTVYSGGQQVAQVGVTGEASECLDTSTESSDSPQGISGHKEGLYGLPAALATG